MRYLERPGACLLFLAAIPAWSQPCEIPDAVKEALAAARSGGASARQAAQKVREQFPQDYFAHRAYQEAWFSRGVFSAEVQGEYRALRDLHPEDPLFLTLYARALTGSHTNEALAILNAVLARDPAYPYAHLKLAEIYQAPNFRDDGQMRQHLLAYRNACPGDTRAYTMAARTEDTEFLNETAAAFRPVLEKRTDADALTAYATLWSMEFKVVPLSQQDGVRDRIRADVARLRNMEQSEKLAPTLLQGYKMLGNNDGIQWAEKLLPATHAGMSPAMETINKWQQENLPKRGSDYQQYQEKMAKQADQWIRQWPDDAYPRFQKFQALRGQRDAPLEETTRAAEEWLRVYEAHPGNNFAPYDMVAQFYAQRNMRYDELPGLLEKALNSVKEPPPPSLSDLYPPNTTAQLMANTARWGTWNSAAGSYLKIKQYDKTRELLAKLETALRENRPAPDASESQTRQYRIQEMQFWENKANLARAEEHKLDALMFQRNAYRVNPFPAPAGAQDFRVNAVQNLWKELEGGTDEGFEAFLHPAGGDGARAPTPAPAKEPSQPAVAATAGNWTTMDKPLPDFQFSDAEGKTWRLADLKGKVTLINLWATWCGPCRAELPYLQKVYNKVRERKDLQVITFNTDDSLGLILPFLAENKYTFPVMPAVDYVHKIVPELSIPRNWIVDVEGVLRREKIGFGTGDAKWVDEMVAAMEQARK